MAENFRLDDSDRHLLDHVINLLQGLERSAQAELRSIPHGRFERSGLPYKDQITHIQVALDELEAIK